MVREEELVQKAKEVREALIEMAADEVDATHIEVGQIKAKDDTRKLLTVRVGGANRYVPYQGHDTSEFTVGDYWAIIFDDYGTIRLGWWVTNNAGGGTIPFRPHNLLDGDAHPDTVAQGVTRGSVIVGDSTPEWNELVIGLAARYLRSDGTDPAYAQIPASEVVNTPAGGIAATDVQAALNELDTEKAPTHNLLDGTWHPDTVAQGATRGSVIVGDSTPAWNEVVIGAANRIFLSDGADAGWGQADHGAALVGLLDDDHTIYFLADCTRAFGGDPIPDGADTRSLGSVDAEWLNIYVGESGKIYFRLDQSVNLYSSAAGVLKTDDHFHATRVFVGDGLVGSPSFAFISDVDTGLYRIGANDLGFTTNSTLAFELNAVQQALVTNGTVAAPGLAFISDPDTGLYWIGANRLAFATNGTLGLEIDASQVLWIGSTKDTNLYRDDADILRTDDHFHIVGDGAGRGLLMYRYTTDAFSPYLYHRKARGSEGSPANVENNDILGRWIAWGYNAGGFRSAGEIKFEVDGAPGGTYVAGRMSVLLATDAAGRREVLRIDHAGQVVFVGAGGLIFGSCYGNHIGWAQANAAQNTWYNIADADIAGGQLHGVTHDGNGKLTVTEPGMYLITYSLCYEDTIANDHVEVGIEINGSGAAEGAGRTHSENKFANEEEHLSGCAVLDLADNSTIELAIRTTDAGTPNILVQGMNISVVQFGGT